MNIQMNEEYVVKKKYENARSNLLLVIIFSVLNVLFVLAESDLQFLFTASIPQIFSVFAYAFGMGECYFYALLVIGGYLLCYFLAKKRYGWMVAALACFIIDWLALFFGHIFLFEVNLISLALDVAFHIWITVYLVSGVKYGKKYCENKLYEKHAGDYIAEAVANLVPTTEETPALHALEEGRGRKVYIRAEYQGMEITVSRRKRITELCVNGFVYAEYKILNESRGYTLNAVVNGVPILLYVRQTSLFYGTMSLFADGKLLGEKKRA